MPHVAPVRHRSDERAGRGLRPLQVDVDDRHGVAVRVQAARYRPADRPTCTSDQGDAPAGGAHVGTASTSVAVRMTTVTNVR